MCVCVVCVSFITYRYGNLSLVKPSRVFLNILKKVVNLQPSSQALSSPKRKTLVGSGHVSPRL